jgi:flagellar hook-associated protein 1 FlgK
VSLNGIAASAISALKTNSAALGVVANNVANLNTPGYARRIVNQQTLSAGGQLMGVDIATIQRVSNQFLVQEQLAASGAASQYDTMAGLFSQLNGLLGSPGDNQSLATQLTNLSAAFATASQSPTSSAGRTGVMNALNSLAQTFSNVSGTITALRSQVDQQAVNSIASTNTLIKQVYDLNTQIRAAAAGGNGEPTALIDQRDVVLSDLAKVMGIKTSANADGSVNVSTTDGVNLVSNTYAQLSYSGTAQNGAYNSITIQDINPANGQTIGSAFALDPHLDGGSLKGLIDMRDQVLGGLSQSLGNLAQHTALAFNAQSNANAAYPPPTSLAGRNTGLLSTDGLNFTGKTTIAVASSSGNLVSRIDVDFNAGTLSVNGGGSVSIGTTVGSFTTALNTALGANGSASFTNGQLSIAATGSNGILVQDDATTPSLRGNTGFSQFFGLNDLFKSQVPSITATGLAAGDASGIAAGGVITMSLKGTGGRYRQDHQHHHHSRPDGGQYRDRVECRDGRCRDLHPEFGRFDLNREQRPLSGLFAERDRRHHPAWRHGHELYPDFRFGRQCPGLAGGRLLADLRCQRQSGARGLCQPRHHAHQRRGQHHRIGRRQFRRHRAAECDHQNPGFPSRRRYRRSGRVAVGLRGELLSECFHPIERGHRQPDHPGRPLERSRSAHLVRVRRQSG